MHVVLSVLVGAYLVRVGEAAVAGVDSPTALLIAPPHVPLVLRAGLSLMGLGALAAFVIDLSRWRRPYEGRKIVVETLIPAPVDRVWSATQDPAQHERWDIRFTRITYESGIDPRGFHSMRYETRLGFGLRVEGFGNYLSSRPPPVEPAVSTFEFDSRDWKSLITRGRGVWHYRSQGSATLFRTVFDYDVRHGCIGYWIDRLVFRRVMQLATEWGFETLRQWCSGDEGALARRASRWRFAVFFVARLAGMRRVTVQ
jgi:hypothetical protein